MTESEWLAATDPKLMLEFLRGKASDRKLRLFTVACARLVWDHLTVADMRIAVETGERFADGLATDDERQQIMSRMYFIPYNAKQGDRELAEFLARPREYYFAYLSACSFRNLVHCERRDSRSPADDREVPSPEAGHGSRGPRDQ